jgi:hypothetical protein
MASGSTLLIDEADNLLIERSMRSALNAGHKAGGEFARVIKNKTNLFPVFGPVALAAIGTLPLTIMSRSVVVNMHRADPKSKIVRFDRGDANQTLDLLRTKNEAVQWANQVQLNRDPDVPASLGRVADKWRVLIAIADSLGHGETARNAAATIMGEYVAPDVKILLLRDIRVIFNTMDARILPSKVLVDKLLDLEDSEYDWSEYRLTQTKLGRVLSEFQIKAQQGWWPEYVHRDRQRHVRYYARRDFESMWRRYAGMSDAIQK